MWSCYNFNSLSKEILTSIRHTLCELEKQQLVLQLQTSICHTPPYMDQSKEIKGIISRYYSSKTTNSGMRNGAVHGSGPTMHISDKKWYEQISWQNNNGEIRDVDYDSWGSTCGVIAGWEFGGNHLLSAKSRLESSTHGKAPINLTRFASNVYQIN